MVAALPQFTGLIWQTPPQFSAIKIAGERAYDLARDGAQFEIAAREILVHRLELVDHAGEQSTFEADCGKGAYVRSLARDLGRALGCYGHVSLLRRTRVGPFLADAGVTFAAIEAVPETLAAALLGVEAGLSELQRVTDRPQRRRGAATRPASAAARAGRPGGGTGLRRLLRLAGRGRRRRERRIRLDAGVQPGSG